MFAAILDKIFPRSELKTEDPCRRGLFYLFHYAQPSSNRFFYSSTPRRIGVRRARGKIGALVSGPV